MIRRGYILSLGAVLLFVSAAIGASSTALLLDPPGPNEYLFPDRPVILPIDTPDPANAVPLGPVTAGDTAKPVNLPYPLEDRQGDHVTGGGNNPFLLNDPAAIEKNVEYDVETDRFIITETVNGTAVRPPVYMTFEEYLEYEEQQARREYYRERVNSITLVEKQGIIPKIVPQKEKKGFFGDGGIIDIKPSGNVDITLGGNVQKIDNPILTRQARKQGGFDFDMNINMSVVGNIADLLKINLTYNTGATFDFENQIKLKYEGEEDDIIRSISAGNVSFPLTTSLIQGSQSLFGVATKLQFGRLTISNVFSQQKSRAQNLQIQNGAQVQTFEVFTDEYDENRHYFLTHAFRDNYNDALATLPNISSQVQVTRLEVWVTNRTGATQNVRDVVAFQDLAEPVRIYNPLIIPTGAIRPNNNANNLYSQLTQNPGFRNIDQVSPNLVGAGLQPTQDYEKVFARQLTSSEYTFNPVLGYVSLNQALYPDEVLAVAFEYTYNGEVFKVGEFAQDIPPDSIAASKVLFLKMLKATSIRPTFPVWDLMMKNIYSIGAFQVNQEDFKLEVFYQEPGGGLKRYLPAGSLQGQPLVRVVGLDRFNNQGDPQPDGVFDFRPGITINPVNGRIIFPVLEPFGSDLRAKFPTDEQTTVAENIVYDELYDSIKVIAQQYPQYNRFVMKGQYKSSISSEISLGAFNVPPGSVVVTAGGQRLTEGQDFSVDYSLGRVKILNEGVLNSGVPINVSFENNTLFGFQQRTLFGTRLDYWVSDKFSIGATHMFLKERPFTQKVNIGDDPIANNIMGVDFKYNTQSQFLTWLVDKLPFYSTKEVSSFSLTGEMAHLSPGHSKAIGGPGLVYIDDFEGSSSSFDLKFPAINWRMSSTPLGASNNFDSELFPEARLFNDLAYGYNRSKLAWYNIDPGFVRNTQGFPDYYTNDQLSNHYIREVLEQEVFPNRTPTVSTFQQNLVTFDLSYFPSERGQYNFEFQPNGQPGISSGINPNGTLKNPRSRWGGITRAIDNNNFEAANIEFIEIWMMDPFIYNENSSGGDMYINLGNISEDILKDSRFFYENGLPQPGSPVQVDNSTWGKIPRVPPIVNAFDNDPDVRGAQDVGFDGLNDDEERVQRTDFLTNVQGYLDPAAFTVLQNDPASDNYQHYLDGGYTSVQASITDRYKKFNNPQGNSPVQTGNTLSNAGTNNPDSEDLNRDNTINENEQYFQYRVNLHPNMEVGENYIVNIQTPNVKLKNGTQEQVRWYQMKIPINEYETRVGNIPDFKSIRFIRVFLTGWDEPVIIRMGRFELVRNQWRRYLQSLQEPGEYIPEDNVTNTFFNVIAVNIEENGRRNPIPYILPPGIRREQNLNTQNINAQQNEQSVSVQVCGLQDGDSRAIYKNINLDIRQYKRMRMFIHAESLVGAEPIKDGDVTAFIRIGSDFTQNYYEYEIPLVLTPYTFVDSGEIWKVENELNLNLDSLISLKLERNANTENLTNPYRIIDAQGNQITIVGNPDMGVVRTVMLGIRNPKKVNIESADDGLPKCVEVWYNELRLEGFEEQGGWAAMARMETRLADLGNIVFSTNMHTIGFGQIEMKNDQRFRDQLWQYDFAANLELGKFFPLKSGIRIPFYGGVSQTFSTPQYDPYQLDVPLEEQLKLLSGSDRRDYKRRSQTLTLIKGYNFSNVRVINQKADKPPRIWDIYNWNFTWAYSEILKSDPFLESDFTKRYRASIGWNFAPKERSITPLKNVIKSRSKYLDIIKDINFNPVPNSLSFNTDFNRQYGEVQQRKLGDEEFVVPATFNKYFTWDRMYGIKWNPFKSLNLDFSAINNARIDEPTGRLNTKEKKDTLWSNIFEFGRTTRYQHSFNANYNVPIDKIPFLDWVQIRTGYGSTYSWVAAPLVLDGNGQFTDNPLGNTLNNSNNIRLNGEFNIKNLYDKSKFLKPYNSNRSRQGDTKEKRAATLAGNKKREDKIEDDIKKQKEELVKAKQEIKAVKASDDTLKKEKLAQIKLRKKSIKERIKKLKADKQRILSPESPGLSPLIRPLISVKRISVNYTETRTTSLPGYLPKTRFIGQDKGFNTPGLDFAFGTQPTSKTLDEYANNNWISSDTLLNYQFMQTVSKNLNIRGVIEPFRDLRVDLTLTKTTMDNFNEFFKVRTPGGEHEHLSPLNTGSVSISYIAIKTFFQKPNALGFTQAFKDFEAGRDEISQRLANGNPNSNELYFVQNTETGDTLRNFREGYGPYSQDVLIPAFISAYTGKSLNDVTLNPFKLIPLPNWRITYNGLSKMKGFDKLFTNFTISHAYNSTFTMSGFISNLNFEGSGYFEPTAIDTLTNNYYPQKNIPAIVISEQFAPLSGVDITWKNGITTKFDYKKSRNLSMSFVSYQMSESRTEEFTFGFGYRLKGLSIPNPFNKKKKVKLKNDINFRVDVSYRDNVTLNNRLDQEIIVPTAGMKTIRVAPSIDYIINQRLNIRIFLDRTRSIPATSASFPITNTRAGITLRFTL
ncbi:cell surface protein SprA [soil metagenome]